MGLFELWHRGKELIQKEPEGEGEVVGFSAKRWDRRSS